MSQAALHGVRDAARRKDLTALSQGVSTLRSRFVTDEFAYLEAAIDVKELGFPDIAETMFRDLASKSPAYSLVHYELAVVLRYSGKLREAAASAQQAVRLAPGDFRLHLLYIHMLHAIGAHPEADAEASLARPRSEQESEQLSVLSNFGEYLKEHPPGRGDLIVEKAASRFGWLAAADVAGLISAAVSEGRGFALIRLGDGEGAFARVSADDERRYATLYRWMRNDWIRFLFGPDFDPDKTGYTSLTEGLMDAACEADVLGIPYPTWVEHEYKTSSIRGVPCTLNVARELLTRGDQHSFVLCPQIVHIHLHDMRLIEPIIRRAGKVTLVSCLDGLQELVKDRFGLEDVEMIKVPREFTAPHLSTSDHVGSAFPELYERLMLRFAQPHEGRVFVIAAGTLGKFYAAQIKRAGGIALDLGSLIDGWMRLPSRAGYDEKLAL